MVCRFLFFVFFVFCVNINVFSHSFYVSLCSVYQVENKLFFSIRLFKNDVFGALKITDDVTVNLKEKQKVMDYVSGVFIIRFDGVQQILHLESLGYEGEDYTETLNLKYSTPYTENIKKIHITNKLLSEFFDDQINVVNLNVANQKKTLTYNKSFVENWIEIK